VPTGANRRALVGAYLHWLAQVGADLWRRSVLVGANRAPTIAQVGANRAPTIAQVGASWHRSESGPWRQPALIVGILKKKN
jgi:hypothetical protein